MKNRICVVFTGGTIGSSVENGTVGLKSENKSFLINEYKKLYGETVVFDVLSPVDMLSENVVKEDLEKIAECIGGIDCSRYDGIILTHGTDTLSFTANYLSQLFCGISVPVVLVSAMYPLEDARSNGLENFVGAVTFIRTSGAKGVFVSFANSGEPCRIHLASRFTDAKQMDGGFESLKGLYFGTAENGVFTRNPDPRNPTVKEIRAAVSDGRKLSLCTDVIAVHAHALIDFGFYTFESKKPKAVVIKLYHSGTVCTVGGGTNAVKFAERCRGDGIEVVLSPLDGKANVYSGMKNVFGDCVKAYDISFEMTVVKVMLALGSGIPISRMLDENNFFEKV